LAFCAHCGKELPTGAIVCPYCGTPVPGAQGAPQAQSQGAGAAPVSGIDALTKDSKAQDFWFRRVIAYIIDALIVYVPLTIILTLVAFSMFLGGFGYYAFLFGGYTFLIFFIFILYNIFFEVSSGATFGKRFFQLKVTGRSGQNPTAGESFIRNISKIHPLLVLLDVIIGLAVSKEYSQKWTDTFAGTKVVSTRQ
jgi:uncharacterized RDD family membrane protein YckC